QYLARESKAAYAYLESLKLSTPEPDAERLYYLLECARRLDRIDEMSGILDKLSEAYPQSAWRLEALVTAGNYYSPHNRRVRAEPLYRTCAESFAGDSQSAQCHWKIAWSDYLRDHSHAAALFRDHLKRYPDSDRASTALYFLGRIAELQADLSAARVYYEEINDGYPNYYYATLARERLRQAG